MRARTFAILFTALVLAACGGEREQASVEAGKEDTQRGWTVQVLGDEGEQVFLVTGPDGKEAAARVSGGASTLMDGAEAQGLLARGAAAAKAEDLDDKVTIEAPGFSLKVAADDAGQDGHGRVAIKAGSVDLFVDGEGEGPNGGRGLVRIGGLDEEAARKFIDSADELSDETKAQMRERLGL